MENFYLKAIKRIGIYSILLLIISLIYIYFSKVWSFAGSIPLLYNYIVAPAENFIFYFAPEDVVISVLLLTGLFIAIILSFLLANQIVKMFKEMFGIQKRK